MGRAATTSKRSDGLRVLGRLRLSIASDESTSIERQREAIEAWAVSAGHTIAGWAVDTDVSGSVDPFDTPQLGDWLNNRADEFDVIAAWKLDRLSRNSIKLSKLIGWCLDHDKTLVSTSEQVDLGTPVGRLIANVIAFLAEGELEAIRERTISSRRKLRETARWAGGRPPYGYRAVDNPNGSGKTLAIDPEAHAVVRRIVDAVFDGVPLARIADQLNRDGVPSPTDHYKGTTGGKWQTWPMKHMLRSPTLVGHAHLGGVTVRDDHGQPVQMGEPLVSDDERELILAELERQQSAPRERLDQAALIGIASCYFCRSPLTVTTNTKRLAGGDTRTYRYYRCPKSCSSLIPCDQAELLAEETFLSELGDSDVTERVWVPGDSNETALRAAVAAFDELSATAGVLTSRTAKDRLARQLAALDQQIAELEAVPAREGRYEDRPTGEKYRHAWERHADDPEARRDMLKRSGITFSIGISSGAWYANINSPVPIDPAKAKAERQRWGVPD